MLCDGDDCYQSENDTKIYHIDFETKEFLKEHCKHWFNAYEDICQDCIDQANMDYPNFFVFGKYNDISIGKEYLDNPNLLK
jgi:hypothetical protein